MTAKDAPFKTPLGFELPLPRWARHLLALVVCLGIALAIYQREVGRPQEGILSLQQANAQLAADIAESGKHLFEVPAHLVTSTVGDESASLGLYADWCGIIKWQTPAEGIRTRLIRRALPTPMAHRLGPQPVFSGLGLSATVHAAGVQSQCASIPHPAPSTWGYGARIDQCWIEVWYGWPEGCVAVRRLNTCQNYFESNPDGSPRVVWTQCRH